MITCLMWKYPLQWANAHVHQRIPGDKSIIDLFTKNKYKNMYTNTIKNLKRPYVTCKNSV